MSRLLDDAPLRSPAAPTLAKNDQRTEDVRPPVVGTKPLDTAVRQPTI